MPLLELESPDELRGLIGHEVVVSDWIEIGQTRINQFAEATGDHQWIHVDVERATRQSPYKSPIAHGFLTLSLLSRLFADAIHIRGGIRMGLNYGLNRVRFPCAAPAGKRIRGRFTLQSLEEKGGSMQATWGIVVELEGSDKPCCVAEWLTRYYFGS